MSLDSERQLDALVEAALDAVVMIDSADRITLWNPAAERIFGLTKGEAFGAKFHETLVPPRYRSAFCAGLARFAETGEGPLVGEVSELPALRADGTEFPAEISISATRLQGDWYAIGIVRDITDRKAAERTLAWEQQVTNALQRVLSELAQEVQEPTDVYQRVCDIVVEETGVYGAWVGGVDDQGRVNRQANAGTLPSSLGGFSVDRDAQGLEGSHPVVRAIREGTSIVVHEAQEAWPAETGMRGAVGTAVFPIWHGEELCGVLQVYSTAPEFFTEPSVTLLEEIVRTIGFSLGRYERQIKQKQLSEIIAAAPEAIGMADSAGRSIYHNPGWVRLMGPVGKKDTSTMEDDFARSYPDWAKRVMREEAFPAAYRDGFWQGELAVFDAQGRETPVAQTLIAHRDGHGLVRRYSTIIRDLAQIKEAEHFSELLLKSLGEGVFGIDSKFRFTFLNPRASDLFGFGSDDEPQGLDSRHLIRQLDAQGEAMSGSGDPVVEAIDAKSHLQNWEGVFRNRQGVRFPVVVSVAPVWKRDGVFQGCVVAFHDISERREAERARDRLVQILEAAPDFIGIADPEGRVVYHNGGARRMLTGSRDGPMAQKFITDRRPEWARKRLREEALPTVRENGLWRGEMAFLDADGAEIPVSQTIIGHFSEDGTLNRLSTIARDISREKAHERELQTERDYSEAILQALPGVFYLITPERRFARWNQRFQELLGYDQEALANTDPVALFAPSEQPQIEQRILEVFEKGFASTEGSLIDRTGKPVPHYFTGIRVLINDRPHLIGVGLDISERKRFEEEIRELNELAVSLLEGTSDAYMALDSEFQVRYFNASAEEVFSVPRTEMIGKTLDDSLPGLVEVFGDAIHQAVTYGDRTHVERFYPPRDGYLEGRFYPGDDGVWAFFRDVTEQRRLKAELERLATHDRLTGIFNRTKLYELLETARAEQQRFGTAFSLIMLDIDHFKRINDTLGHVSGDEALQELVGRINGVLRATDAFGRWGGEEFLVLASHTGLEGARQLAERIREVVGSQPFSQVGVVTVSLGVAEAKPDEPPESLEERLDQALYRAKRYGRNRAEVAGE